MSPSTRKTAVQTKIIRPRNFNIGPRGDQYIVFAVPLVPAAGRKHPFRGLKSINITKFVESISWSSSKDEAGVISGSLTVKNPANVLGILVPGSRIVVKQATRLTTGSTPEQMKSRRFVKVLELIVRDRDKQQVELQMQLGCSDRLFYLTQGKHDFNFKKKKGKKGKTASEIIRKVCRDERVPFNKTTIPTTRQVLEKVSGEDTTILQFFLDVLKAHNKRVDKANGKKPPPPNWDIHMRTGILTIRPRRKPRTAWFLDERQFISEPSYQESTKGLATRVTVKGKNTTYRKKFNKDGSVSKRKKSIKKGVSVTVEDAAMIRAYGLIHHTEKVSGNLTPEKARRMANSILNKKSRLSRSLQFTCPALPGIWVGSKVYLHCPTYGMRGLFTVTAFEYSISGEGHTMSLTVDAGSRPISSEAVPPLIAIKKYRILGKHRDKATGQMVPGGVSVKVFWSDGFSKVYTNPHAIARPKRWRVARVVIRHINDVALQEVGKKGETAVIHYANKKHMTVPNRVKWPAGLTSAADEGYIPQSEVTA